jgi:hypothetical protein
LAGKFYNAEKSHIGKGRYDPSGEAKLAEKLKDPNNPLRQVLDLLLENAKEMVRDGRMKIVDGVPVLSPEVEKMLAERKARAHARCTEADPCGGIYNERLQRRQRSTRTVDATRQPAR